MFDFHIHSNFSDGSNTLKELILKLAKNNIELFALTDHDTAAGCREILSSASLKQLLAENNLKFLTGAEWSCIYNGHKMHILAYDFNPFDPKVLNLEKQMRNMLDMKDKYRWQYLEENGYIFSEKSKQYLSLKENVRSMDFAKCLVEDGYFQELQEAFSQCLNKIKYPFICRYDAVEVLKTLSLCGAKLVWAHSIYDMKRKVTPYEYVEKIIDELKPYGLAGLECYYSLYSKEEIEKLIEIAKKHDLFVTFGSDYHGDNKEVKIGQFSSDGFSIDVENIVAFNQFKNIFRG